MPAIADRLSVFTESVIREMTRVANRYGAINLSRGFPDADPPPAVLAAGKPLSLPVGQCMTPNPEVVDRKESIAGAVRRMERGGYRHLPMVNEDGQPVGVVSVKRVMQYLAEHFPTIIYNQPPNPDAVPQEREGA